jgi:competence protein ComEA
MLAWLAGSLKCLLCVERNAFPPEGNDPHDASAKESEARRFHRDDAHPTHWDHRSRTRRPEMKTSRTLSTRSLSNSAIPFSSLPGTRNGARRLAAVLLLLATLFTGLPAMAAEAPAETGKAGVVNINTATAEQLKQLPRVGPALADRILAYRETNGKFESTEDLILVQGIGEKTFELLRSFVAVEGKTTLERKLKASDVPAKPAAGSPD